LNIKDIAVNYIHLYSRQEATAHITKIETEKIDIYKSTIDH